MAPLDLDALRDLHNSANNLLHSQTVQQAIVHQREEKWVNEVSEASLGMLDVCELSKDILLLVKQHLQDLQFTLHRASIGKPVIGDKITAYNVYRKKLKKEILECLKCLKRMKSKTMISVSELVVDVLREVRVISICSVESLVSLISGPWLDYKSGKGSLASKLARVSGQIMTTDDLYDVVMLQSVNKRLEGVHVAIEDLELELGCMIRRLIHTRVLLLNILIN